MAEVKVRYNNLDIAAIQKPGGMTLQTAGKYMGDNVEVQYTDPNPNVIQDQDGYLVLSDEAGGGGGASVADVLQGEFPSGAVSFKATKNIPGRGVSGRSAITSLEIDLTDNYTLNGRAVENNSNLTQLVLIFPTSGASTNIGDYGVTSNAKLKNLIFRGKPHGVNQSGLRSNSALEVVDVEKVDTSYQFFGSNCFYGSNNFQTLIIRETSGVLAITSDSFTGSGLVSSGVVYVPSSLISSYQSASNWSSLYSGGKLTFSALENSAYASADWYKA